MAPVLQYDGVKISLKFSRDLVRQSRVTCNHRPKINIFFVYKLNSHTINDDFTLKDGLFGSVKITEKDKNNYDDYVYSGFDICFDSKSRFTHSDSSTAHIVIVFGVDGSQSMHSGNKSAGNLKKRKRFNTKNK